MQPYCSARLRSLLDDYQTAFLRRPLASAPHRSRHRPPPAATPRLGYSRAPKAARQPRRRAPAQGAVLCSLAMPFRMGESRAIRSTPGRRPREGQPGRIDATGISNAQRCETHLRCAHVAYETTRDVVGLGDPVERYLARTGRGHGRWNGGQLARTQETRAHRFLGQGGKDPERAASA
jgi:hypothetical protein